MHTHLFALDGDRSRFDDFAHDLGGGLPSELCARFGGQAGGLATEALADQADQEQRRLRERFFRPGRGKETIVVLRTELNQAMESGAGIYRSEESLRAACDTVRELKSRFDQLELADHSLTFNTELTTALELEFLLDVAEALAHSALQRTESRGSHQRTDYPERDDERFLKHSLAYQSDGDPRIEYLDVVITRWPPGERVYGSK
ncbi:MAG: hypothetical protein IIA53_04350 [Chloroflexi bacterium]|nr:hypothetical protein [Chloroflexota bacterium]